MALFRRARGAPRLAEAVAARLSLGRGEWVLAHAVDRHTGRSVVFTSWHVLVVDPADGQVVRRAWREVNGGSWEPRTRTISVTWTDGGRPAQWTMDEGGEKAAEVLRERVQASIVVAEEIRLGDRLCGRVAIRKDLASGQLSDQVVFARGVRADDPALVDYVAAVRADLRDQAGL